MELRSARIFQDSHMLLVTYVPAIHFGYRSQLHTMYIFAAAYVSPRVGHYNRVRG